MIQSEFYERQARLRKEAQTAGEPMFLGIPESWYEAGKWGCRNGHVSTTYLKSEARGGSVCLACFEPVMLIHPATTEPEAEEEGS